jgi:hypothetical protein
MDEIVARLRREKKALVEAIQDLLSDREYLQIRADYNRGHLSHYGWLNSRESKLHTALRSTTASEPT